MAILAALAVVDAVAVARVEIALRAVAPDGVLHEPRKDFGKASVELTRIDGRGDRANDVGAASGLVTAGAIRVDSIKPVQDAGAVQEIVHQRVDGDHAGGDFGPCWVAVGE